MSTIHSLSIVLAKERCHEFFSDGESCYQSFEAHPLYTKHLYNICTMLYQRRRMSNVFCWALPIISVPGIGCN